MINVIVFVRSILANASLSSSFGLQTCSQTEKTSIIEKRISVDQMEAYVVACLVLMIGLLRLRKLRER